jgi:hypothetical protein
MIESFSQIESTYTRIYNCSYSVRRESIVFLSIKMRYLGIQLFDLPDEILLIIFEKFNNIELFYSLIGVHQRLDNVLHDSIFTNTLTLLDKFSPPHICSLSPSVLDRLCSQVLPDIAYKIKWLNVEGSSLARILSAEDFPNLSGLGVYRITKTHALHLLTG